MSTGSEAAKTTSFAYNEYLLSSYFRRIVIGMEGRGFLSLCVMIMLGSITRMLECRMTELLE